VHPAAAASNAPETDQLPSYLRFRQAVAQAQLAAWLPRGRQTIVDVSGPRGPGAELAAQAGHTVLRVTGDPSGAWGASTVPDASGIPGASRSAGPARAPGASRSAGPAQAPGASGRDQPGTVAEVAGDPSQLSFLRDGCVDAVIAEDRALSVQLAAEATMAEIGRVLRPGGRVLASVDSLVFGMSVLAGQHRWAYLVDVPHAEVVLVPWPDGTITRCYGPDQARELFSGAGLSVRSIRSRTMLCESVVDHVLRRIPHSMPRLVRAELAARSDDSLGTELLISAVKKREPDRR
jgi:SAM-dependent methyltransferase